MSSTANVSKFRTTAAIVMALLALFGSAAVMIGNESDAAISGNYGPVYEIDLAPGFSYTYTPTYPADLDVTTTISGYIEREPEDIRQAPRGMCYRLWVIA